jgi:hypothetical protein
MITHDGLNSVRFPEESKGMFELEFVNGLSTQVLKSKPLPGLNRHGRKHSKLGVIVEHTVSRIKKFGIMGTKFRNKLGRYDHASDIVSGLVNFRIMRTNRTLL